MQRIISVLFLVSLFACYITPATASESAVGDNDFKSFNLKVVDNAILNQDISPEMCFEPEVFSLEQIEPNAGDESGQEELNVLPEFNYGKKDDDYNDRLDQYNAEVKLKFKLPVDFK